MRSSVTEIVLAAEEILGYLQTCDQTLITQLQRLNDAVEEFHRENRREPVILSKDQVDKVNKMFMNEGRDNPTADLAFTALYYIGLSDSLMKHTGSKYEKSNPNKLKE